MSASAIRVPLVRARLGRLDDGRLATLAAAGDERAFEALYDRHHLALLGFCRHLLRSHDEAEDALQQTFLRAHRALLAHGAPEEPRPWLFAIARNRCKTMLAARRPDAVAGEEDEPATEGLGIEVERRADLRALLADVERLPEDQRAALVLAELADLSHPEIAAVIGVPVNKVKALVHQARTRLIAERDARETPCEQVREQLATARGGALRRGPLRRHLRGCEPCRAYRSAIGQQRAALGLVLPVLPSAGLKEAVLGAISGGGGGAAAAAGGVSAGVSAGSGALTSGGVVGVAAKGIGAKLAVGAALVGGAGAGTAVVVDMRDRPQRDVAPAADVRAPAEVGGEARRATATQPGLAAAAATPQGVEKQRASQKKLKVRKKARNGGGLALGRDGKPGRGKARGRDGKPGRSDARGYDGTPGRGQARGHGGEKLRGTARTPKPVPAARAQGPRADRVKPRAAKPKPRGPVPKAVKPVRTPAPVPERSKLPKSVKAPAAGLAP